MRTYRRSEKTLPFPHGAVLAKRAPCHEARVTGHDFVFTRLAP